MGQLTADPIAQRTTFKAYDSNTMLINDHFDIPITSNRHQLHTSMDYTYYFTIVEPGEYQFKKIDNTGAAGATVIMDNVMLDCYTSKSF